MPRTSTANLIDHAEYPISAEIEQRCVRMLADLFHAPGRTTGCRTHGSSEAMMLGALSLEWKWRERRQAANLSISNPTSIMFGLLAVAATAFLGAVFLTGDARRFDAPDLIVYFRRRGLLSLTVLVVLVVITLFATSEDAPHVWHGLAHGAGPAFGTAGAAAAFTTAWLLVRRPGGWARASAVGAIALRSSPGAWLSVPASSRHR